MWCFPHAQSPSSWDGLGDPSQGKAGQTYLAATPHKGSLCRSDEVVQKHLLLGINMLRLS